MASGHGLLCVQCQAITFTNAKLLSTGPIQWNLKKNKMNPPPKKTKQKKKQKFSLKINACIQSAKWLVSCYNQETDSCETAIWYRGVHAAWCQTSHSVLLKNIFAYSSTMQHFPYLCVQGSYYTEPLQAHNPNLSRIHVPLIRKILIGSGHNFADAMAAQLPWHVKNFDLIWSLFFKLEHNIFLKDLDYKLVNAVRNAIFSLSSCPHKATWPKSTYTGMTETRDCF